MSQQHKHGAGKASQAAGPCCQTPCRSWRRGRRDRDGFGIGCRPSAQQGLAHLSVLGGAQVHLPSRCVAVRCRSPWRDSEPSVVSGHASGRLVTVFTIHGEVVMMHDAWPTSFSQLQQRMTSILFCCWCQVSKTEKSRLLQSTHVAARSFSACCVPTPPSYLVRASNLLHTHPPPTPQRFAHASTPAMATTAIAATSALAFPTPVANDAAAPTDCVGVDVAAIAPHLFVGRVHTSASTSPQRRLVLWLAGRRLHPGHGYFDGAMASVGKNERKAQELMAQVRVLVLRQSAERFGRVLTNLCCVFCACLVACVLATLRATRRPNVGSVATLATRTRLRSSTRLAWRSSLPRTVGCPTQCGLVPMRAC